MKRGRGRGRGQFNNTDRNLNFDQLLDKACEESRKLETEKNLNSYNEEDYNDSTQKDFKNNNKNVKKKRKIMIKTALQSKVPETLIAVLMIFQMSTIKQNTRL